MDDRISKKKPTNLVRRVLLDHWHGRHFLGVILLIFTCILTDTAAGAVQAESCDSSARGRVRCAEWYDNGELKIVKKYRNGKRHGTWSYYSEGEILDHRTKYKRGKLIFTFYYKDDKVYKTIDKNGNVRYKNSCDCY